MYVFAQGGTRGCRVEDDTVWIDQVIDAVRSHRRAEGSVAAVAAWWIRESPTISLRRYRQLVFELTLRVRREAPWLGRRVFG